MLWNRNRRRCLILGCAVMVMVAARTVGTCSAQEAKSGAKSADEQSLSIDQLRRKSDAIDHRLARMLEQQSAGDEVRAGYAEQLAVRQAIYERTGRSEDGRRVVDTLLESSTFERLQQQFDKARGDANRALNTARRLKDELEELDASQLLAECLHRLAKAEDKLGRASDAIEHRRDAIELRRIVFRKDATDWNAAALAYQLSDLGYALSKEQRNPEAKTYFEQSLDIWKSRFEDHDWQSADPALVQVCSQTLMGCGLFFAASRDFARAKTSHEQAEKLARVTWEKNGSPQACMDVVMAGFFLARDHEQTGELHAAQQRYQSVLDLLSREPDLSPPALALQYKANCLSRLAIIATTTNHFQLAVTLAEQALEVATTVAPDPSSLPACRFLAPYYNAYATALLRVGDFSLAKACCLRSVSMRRRVWEAGKSRFDQLQLAVSLGRLGQIYDIQGDHHRSLKCSLEVLHLLESLYPVAQFPKGNPDYATALTSVARCCLLVGQVDRATEYALRATEMWKKLAERGLGASDLKNYVGCLQWLSVCHRCQANDEEALAALNEAETLLRQHSEIDDNRTRARLLLRKAMVALAQGDTRQAKEWARQSSEMFEGDSQGHRRPGYELLAAAWHMAKIDYADGRNEDAVKLLIRSINDRQSSQLVVVNAGSETELVTWKGRFDLLSWFLSVGLRAGVDVSDLYSHLWRDRGDVQQMMARRQRQVAGLGKGELADLVARRQAVAAQMARYIRGGGIQEERPTVGQLSARLESLDQEIARRTAIDFDRLAAATSDVRQLQTRLAEDECFIHLICYTDYPPNAQFARWIFASGTPRCLAVIVRHDAPLVMIPLGDVDDLHEAVSAYRAEIEMRGGHGPAAQRLANLVWQPMAAHLPRGARRIYIASDGPLAMIPWGALPAGTRGRVLLEQFAFASVPSGRWLLLEMMRGPSQMASQDPKRTGSVLIVGDVDFDRRPSEASAVMDAARETPSSGPPPVEETVASLSFLDALPLEVVSHTRGGAGVWNRLPATALEVDQIAALASQRNATVLRGGSATPDRVLRELPGKRWIHLATHGFFIGDPLEGDVAVVTERSQSDSSRIELSVRNPLLRCGLALAGANISNSPESPLATSSGGIITGEMITYVPLDGTDLVVLSACETGRGTIAAGEGVIGLQRAFHTAGARNVVASLWQVDDVATATMMERFYRKMWNSGMTPLEALREAQLEMARDPVTLKRLSSRRGIDLSRTTPIVERPGEETGEISVPVYFWGGFTLSGLGR